MAPKKGTDSVVKDLASRVAKLSAEYDSIGSPVFIRSGSVVFDALLGGGIPQGVFISWASESGCGKTTGALHIAKAFCSQGKSVIYLDYEGGVNESQLAGIGVLQYLYNSVTNPTGTFFLYQVQTYKDAEKILDEIMADVDLVVIDSVTAMLTEKVKGASSEDILPGQDARVMATFMKKYKAEARRSGTTWLMINQMRTKIAMGYGQVTKDEAAGGNAMKFYPDIRLLMKKAYKGALEKDEETATGVQKIQYGQICDISAEKNRYARPKIPLKLAIIFGEGINNFYSYFDFLTAKNVIKKSGAWYTVKFGMYNEKMQGAGSVVDWIRDHKSEVKAFMDELGGYRLLMNAPSTVILTSDNTKSDELYDAVTTSGDISDNTESEDDIVVEFEQMVEG